MSFFLLIIFCSSCTKIKVGIIFILNLKVILYYSFKHRKWCRLMESSLWKKSIKKQEKNCSGYNLTIVDSKISQWLISTWNGLNWQSSNFSLHFYYYYVCKAYSFLIINVCKLITIIFSIWGDKIQAYVYI